jgi:hypothetical protein
MDRKIGSKKRPNASIWHLLSGREGARRSKGGEMMNAANIPFFVRKTVIVMYILCCFARFCMAQTQQVPLKYPIKLLRPFTVGATLDREIVGKRRTQATKTTAGGVGITSTDELSIHFEGRITVLAVDNSGIPTSLRYSIHKCIADFGQGAVAIGKPGDAFVATFSDDTVHLTLNDRAPTDPENVAFRPILGVMPKGLPTPDEVWGSSEPRAVGESWRIQSDPCARMEAGIGFIVESKNIKGESTLVEIKNVMGKRCEIIRTTMECTSVRPRRLALGTEAVSNLRKTTEVTLPIDPSEGTISAAIESTNDIKNKIVNPDGSISLENIVVTTRLQTMPLSN